MKFINYFLVNKLFCKKGKIFSKIIFKNYAFYGLDMEPEPEPKLFKSRNRNRNLSKVGTGTGTVTVQQHW